jgi:hypothetical protein
LIFASAIGSQIKYMPPLTHIFKKKKKPRMIMDPGSGMGGGPQAKLTPKPPTLHPKDLHLLRTCGRKVCF